MSDHPTPPPRVPAPLVVPRWVQLVTLPVGILALWALARAAGTVLLVFIVAAVIALILNPLVAALQRRVRLPRGLAVATVYLGLLAAVVALGFLLANPISDQASKFGRDVPSIIDDANARLADVQDYFDRKGIHVEIKKQGETALPAASASSACTTRSGETNATSGSSETFLSWPGERVALKPFSAWE